MTDVVVIEGVSPLDLARVANEEHRLAGESFGSTLDHVIRAGDALNKAKDQVDHGEWLPWLKANFNGSQQTASKYMRLAANYATGRNLPDPSITKALAALSATNGHIRKKEKLIDEAKWKSLVAAMEAVEIVGFNDASDIAATVPVRRRAATAKRLRKLGISLGRIAWQLESEGTDPHDNARTGSEEAVRQADNAGHAEVQGQSDREG